MQFITFTNLHIFLKDTFGVLSGRGYRSTNLYLKVRKIPNQEGVFKLVMYHKIVKTFLAAGVTLLPSKIKIEKVMV